MAFYDDLDQFSVPGVDARILRHRRESIFTDSARSFQPSSIVGYVRDLDIETDILDSSREVFIGGLPSNGTYTPAVLMQISPGSFVFSNGISDSQSKGFCQLDVDHAFEPGSVSRSEFSLKITASGDQKTLNVSLLSNERSPSEKGFSGIGVKENTIGVGGKAAIKDYLFDRIGNIPRYEAISTSDHVMYDVVRSLLTEEFINQETDFRILAAAGCLMEFASRGGFQEVVFDVKDDLRLLFLLMSVDGLKLRCSDELRSFLDAAKKERDNRFQAGSISRLSKRDENFHGTTADLDAVADGFIGSPLASQVLSKGFSVQLSTLERSEAVPVAVEEVASEQAGIVKDIASVMSPAEEKLSPLLKEVLDRIRKVGKDGSKGGSLVKLYKDAGGNVASFSRDIQALVKAGLVVSVGATYYAKEFAPLKA
ncbi:MAG: hypothetical protein WCT46_02735 [Candidatus Gracilibacteria bacterium]